MKKHYYNRICSNCGRRFRSQNKMAPRCRTCTENGSVKVERRGGVRIETRGRAVIGGHADGYNRSI